VRATSTPKLVATRVLGVGLPLSLINSLMQRVLGLDRDCRFQKNFTSRVLHSGNLRIHGDATSVIRSLAVSGGCYINAHDGLDIGQGTIWAPNVTMVSQHHDPEDLDESPPTSGIYIGRDCWIGVGAVILPGVTIGDGTVIAANAVVNRSFPDGHCLIAGVPARIVKRYRGPELP